MGPKAPFKKGWKKLDQGGALALAQVHAEEL